MTPEQLGELFASLLPQLKKLVRVPHDTPEDEVLNTVLVELLEQAGDIPDDPKQAKQYIKAAVVVVSKRMLRRRTTERDRFPAPATWHLGGRYVGPLLFEDMGGEETDHIDRIPDTRPSPLEEYEAATRAELLRDLTKGLREDKGLRGEIYRRVFLAGRDKRGDLTRIAQDLGISPAYLRQRVLRMGVELKKLLAPLKEGV